MAIVVGVSEQPDPVDTPVAVPGRRPRTRLLLALAGAILLTDLVTKLVRARIAETDAAAKK